MPNYKAVSDEELISALLLHGTVKAAAAAVGAAPRTIYDRMKDNDFKELYAIARADIMRGAMTTARENLQTAMETIRDIMTDEDNPPAVRLQAAQHTIVNFLKFAERLDVDETNKDTATEKASDILGSLRI